MKYTQVIDLYERSDVMEGEEKELCRVQYLHALTQKGMMQLPGKDNSEGEDVPGSTPKTPLFARKAVEDSEQQENWGEFYGGLFMLAGGCIGVYNALSSGSSFGFSNESRKHLVSAEEVTTTFQDMKGVDECLEEVSDVVDFLKNPTKYHEIGARLPKGILLTGEPGTGKTMLARAIAGESHVKFFYNSGSDFEEMFVGVGAKRVRELFEAAKKQAPAIIFIDEIDALGTSRHTDAMVYHRQSLNQLLVEMDGFRETDNIIVIAATNMQEALDPALKRAGRFDKEIQVNLPTLVGRKAILELYLSKVFHDESVNIDHLAKITTGMSGADLSNLVNVAVLHAIKDGRNACSQRDLEIALDRIALGVERKSLVISAADKRAIAIRQAGSFLSALLTNCKFKPRTMTILPRGRQLGNFMLESTVELLNLHKNDVLGRLDIFLGGRIAVELFEGDSKVSNHCEATMQGVTTQLYQIVQTGMFREFTGLPNTQGLDGLGPKYQVALDNTVKSLMEQGYDRTRKKLIKHKGLLEELVEELLEKETMSLAEASKVVRYYCARNGVSITDFFHLE